MAEEKGILHVLLMSAILTMVIGQGCNPDCTGQAVGDKVEDPRNCTQYYICMAGGIPTDFPLPCPPGEEFIAGACAPGAPGSPCTPTCVGTGCHLTCTTIGDHIADPFDCSAFYICDINGPGVVQKCPDSLPYFDHVLQKCVKDETVCCNPGCEPYCDPGVIQVPDPANCNRFYICDQTNPAPILPPFSCPSGEVFDIGTGHCSASGECKVWCSSSPTPNPQLPGSTIKPLTSSSTTTMPTMSDTTTISSSTAFGGCLSSFLCDQKGFFPKCPSICDPRYFYCQAAGSEAVERKCTGSLVFNPVPDLPYCLQPGDCPYIISI